MLLRVLEFSTSYKAQGQRSRYKFSPKMEKILNIWLYFRCYFLFHLQTLYLVQPNKAHSMIQVSMTLWSRSNFPQKELKKKPKQLAISWMLFHPQTSSHLLSQLFVTNLGVALLFKKNSFLHVYFAGLKIFQTVPNVLEFKNGNQWKTKEKKYFSIDIK